MALTGKQKRFLKGLGHALKPVVQIGKLGLAETVLSQVESNLLAHELIKVRVLEGCPIDRKDCGQALARATGADLAQTLGRTLLLYRAHPEHPALKLPDPSP